MYLPWLMKMSSFFCLICNLIKKSNSPHHAHFELILHAFCKFLTKKYISNTEYNIINIYLYNQYVFTFSFCEEGGVNFTNIKLFSIKKKFINLSYHSLSACFKSYITLLSLKT
jgi:hypothetical protein